MTQRYKYGLFFIVIMIGSIIIASLNKMSTSHHHTTGNPNAFRSQEGYLYVEPSPIHFRIPIKPKQPPQTDYQDVIPLTKEDELLMESKEVFLVYEGQSNYGRMAFLQKDVRFIDEKKSIGEKDSGLRLTNDSSTSPSKLANKVYDLYIEGKFFSKAAAWSFPSSTPFTQNTSKSTPSPDQLIVLYSPKYPQIWEEEEIQQGGVRNPYHRVDLVPSKRHVQVYAKSKDAKTDYLIADTANVQSDQKSFALFETNLPVRWYLPSSALITQANQGSIKIEPKVGAKVNEFPEDGLLTVCPYKGYARYHQLTLPDGEVLQNIAWAYPVSLAAFDARGLVSFYAPGNDRLKLVVDGQEI